jgi:hypothetical protein
MFIIIRKILILSVCIIFTVRNGSAQTKKINFSIGPELSVPVYRGISGTGIGGGISVGHFFNKRLEGEVAVSFNHFNGEVLNFNKTDTVAGFSVMPLLPGIKYFISRKFYASGGVGMVIGTRNAANHFALSPGLGFLFPVSCKNKLDAGVKLIGVPNGVSFPENIFLNKGGYSFVTFRVAYFF